MGRKERHNDDNEMIGMPEEAPKKKEPTPGREWAMGLTQAAFEAELNKRCPSLDVMPIGEEWVYFGQPPEQLIAVVRPAD